MSLTSGFLHLTRGSCLMRRVCAKAGAWLLTLSAAAHAWLRTRRGGFFSPRTRRRRNFWLLLFLLLVLAPAFSAAMPRSRRAAKAGDDAAGASSVPGPSDAQHLDSDSQSPSSGSSPALALTPSAPSTEPRAGGQAPDCSVNGSTPFTVFEPSTCLPNRCCGR